MNELRNGTLLVKVSTREQSAKVKYIRRLDGTPVNVKEHTTLNTTKGTIRCKRYLGLEDARILEELKKYDVTEIYRMKTKVDGELTQTGTMVLTFNRCKLPDSVKIGWNIFDVREYIPNPRRCHKCQKFNHGKNTCRAIEPVCCRCREEGHEDNCEKPICCANCNLKHFASDKKCSHYMMEKEIITLLTQQKVNYGEAKKIVMTRFIEPGVTFSDMLRISRESRQQSRNTTLRHRPADLNDTQSNTSARQTNSTNRASNQPLTHIKRPARKNTQPNARPNQNAPQSNLTQTMNEKRNSISTTTPTTKNTSGQRTKEAEEIDGNPGNIVEMPETRKREFSDSSMELDKPTKSLHSETGRMPIPSLVSMPPPPLSLQGVGLSAYGRTMDDDAEMISSPSPIITAIKPDRSRSRSKTKDQKNRRSLVNYES